MEIICPQNFTGMKNILVNKEALCRISGRHDNSIAYVQSRQLELEDLWLDDVVGLCFITPRERERMRKLVSICRYIHFSKKKKNSNTKYFYGSIVAATEKKIGATTAFTNQCYWKQAYRAPPPHPPPPPASPHVEENHTHFDLRATTARGVWDL